MKLAVLPCHRSLMRCLFAITVGVASYGANAASTRASEYLTAENFQQIQLSEFNVNFLHKGKGAPVVLIHGGGEWSYTFRKNIDILAQEYSVYALDLPGHGFTTPRNFSASKLGFPTIRRVLREFLDAQNISRAILLGHSWGGGFAIDFALSSPERVKALVLIGSSGVDVPDHWEWEVLKVPGVGRIAAGTISRWSTRYSLTNAFFDRSHVTEPMVDEVYAPLRNPFQKAALYYLSRNLDWKPIESRLGELSVPTLVIWGEADQFVPLKAGVFLAQKIRSAQFVLVEEAGHNVHEEKSSLVNRTVLTFLKANP